MGCTSTAVKIEKNEKISASTKDSKHMDKENKKANTTFRFIDPQDQFERQLRSVKMPKRKIK